MRDAQQAELAELEKLCANLPEEIAAAKRSIDRLTRESDQLLASAISNELEIEKAERGCVRAMENWKTFIKMKTPIYS